MDQDYNARQQDDQTGIDKRLFGVLLCGVYEEDEVKTGGYRNGAARLGSREWKFVQQNMYPRYQYLGFVPGPDCVLVVDFKDYFFVPMTYLYEQINQEKTIRMASMDSPWRDNLLQRFGFYMIRVGLPTDFNAIVAPAVGQYQP